MASVYDKYEAVIGLEIHAQLLTKSKAYSSDSTTFGASPNTQVSAISLGHPGTLPHHNRKVIEYAIRMGLACESTIREYNYYARKNYFYADLPKGYQITQDKTPICNGGFVNIKLKDGTTKKVGITRIHMEEDAGKSMHDQDLYDTLVDYNRAGVPLIEIVSEPDMRSADEAYAYVSEMRKLVRYLDICDGNMEEGSLRCDANVSVRLKGAQEYGTKVEVKNMNSISNVKRAIEYEIIRQIDLIEAGKPFTSETRSFDAMKGTTFSMRSKEEANDYRYFPEPDLVPVQPSKELIEQIRATLPENPALRRKRLQSEWGFSELEFRDVVNADLLDLVEATVAAGAQPQAARKWWSGELARLANAQEISPAELAITPAEVAEIQNLIDQGELTDRLAREVVAGVLAGEGSPAAVSEKRGLKVVTDEGALIAAIDAALQQQPDVLEKIREGKVQAAGAVIGAVMKAMGGQADAARVRELILERAK